MTMSKQSGKTAIIFAAHPINAGMYSVDKAGEGFFEAQNADCFIAQPMRHSLVNWVDTGFRLKELKDNSQLDDYDRIVYWGDFLNNPLYGAQGFTAFELQYGLSKDKAAAMAAGPMS